LAGGYEKGGGLLETGLHWDSDRLSLGLLDFDRRCPAIENKEDRCPVSSSRATTLFTPTTALQTITAV
jgi:hypothetical protein